LLANQLKDVPKDRPLAVICGSGYRSSVASSLLKRSGYDNVTNVMGGMGAWKAARLPTTAD
jgi:hydroxyacylglutathione hydrolase